MERYSFELNGFNGHFRNNACNSVRWACIASLEQKRQKKEEAFSMVIGNWACTSVFPNICAWEQQE